jgi:hypothetical protein
VCEETPDPSLFLIAVMIPAAPLLMITFDRTAIVTGTVAVLGTVLIIGVTRIVRRARTT